MHLRLTSKVKPSLYLPRVELGYATYEGRSLENDVDEYLGMRYAAPPVGGLRWRAPRDPEPSNGVKAAHEVRLKGLECKYAGCVVSKD